MINADGLPKSLELVLLFDEVKKKRLNVPEVFWFPNPQGSATFPKFLNTRWDGAQCMAAHYKCVTRVYLDGAQFPSGIVQNTLGTGFNNALREMLHGKDFRGNRSNNFAHFLCNIFCFNNLFDLVMCKVAAEFVNKLCINIPEACNRAILLVEFVLLNARKPTAACKLAAIGVRKRYNNLVFECAVYHETQISFFYAVWTFPQFLKMGTFPVLTGRQWLKSDYHDIVPEIDQQRTIDIVMYSLMMHFINHNDWKSTVQLALSRKRNLFLLRGMFPIFFGCDACNLNILNPYTRRVWHFISKKCLLQFHEIQPQSEINQKLITFRWKDGEMHTGFEIFKVRQYTSSQRYFLGLENWRNKLLSASLGAIFSAENDARNFYN